MGRKPLNPTGPMTDAERSARRYARLRKSINQKRRRVYKRAVQHELEVKKSASLERRKMSRTAQPLPDGMELRDIDHPHVDLSDIPDSSIPLILTNPPQGAAAEPYWRSVRACWSMAACSLPSGTGRQCRVICGSSTNI
jgi:hypothetical protein